MKFPNIPIIPDYGFSAIQEAMERLDTSNLYHISENMKNLIENSYAPNFHSIQEMVDNVMRVNSLVTSVFDIPAINDVARLAQHLGGLSLIDYPPLPKKLTKIIQKAADTYEQVAESPYYKTEFRSNPSNKDAVVAIDESNTILNQINERLIKIEEGNQAAEKLNTQRYRIGILIALLTFLYPYLEKYFTITEIEKLQLDMKQIQDSQTEILNLLRENCKVIKTNAAVKAKPQSNSHRTDSLFPKQTVFLIDTSKKWINIQFICPKTGQTKEGWILKKTGKSF